MSLKAKVKQEILKCLIHKCDRAYDRTYQYAKKYLSYDNLISALEAKECKQDINDLLLTLTVLHYSSITVKLYLLMT